MKQIALLNACYYRALTPRWFHEPLSGDGAATTGGRFNPVGYPALYLAASPETALAEARQSRLIMPPRTICSYRVTASNIIDFSEGFTGSPQPLDWSMWDCEWRDIWVLDKERPPSWELADQLISDGKQGLLFPSLRHPGGTNLVLFLPNMNPPDSVSVIDPNNDLPADQSSWL